MHVVKENLVTAIVAMKIKCLESLNILNVVLVVLNIRINTYLCLNTFYLIKLWILNFI